MGEKKNLMAKDPHYYFAYGANLNLNEMARRCPGYRTVASAILRDYELVFRTVADVAPAPGKMVMVAIYELNNAHLESLDRFEGVPNFYVRQNAEVEILQGEKLKVFIYMMTNKTAPSPPNKDYFDKIITGMKQWSLPEEYIKSFILKFK